MAKSSKNSTAELLLTALGSLSTFVIPSSLGELTFKQLTTGHMKRIIQTVVDAPIAGSLFSSAMTQIMKECLLTEGVDVMDLTIADKLLFVLSTRIQSISPTARVDVDGEKREIQLGLLFNEILSVVSGDGIFKAETQELDGGIKLTCAIPTLRTETIVDEAIVRSVSDFDINDPQNLRDMIGKAFISELSKYIYAVSKDDTQLDFSSVVGSERTRIVEQLPAYVTSAVVRYAEKYKLAVDQGLTVKFDDMKEHTLRVDGSLFA